MLAIYEKRAKATPAPDHHYTERPWSHILGKFGGGNAEGGRQTFCDDAIRASKKVPSPTRYDAGAGEFLAAKKQPLGKME